MPSCSRVSRTVDMTRRVCGLLYQILLLSTLAIASLGLLNPQCDGLSLQVNTGSGVGVEMFCEAVPRVGAAVAT